MTKGELIKVIAEAKKITLVSAADLVELIFETISSELVGGGKVSISGFGIFNATTRNARNGVNPKTGEKIQIAASKSVKFRPGKELKDKINS